PGDVRPDRGTPAGRYTMGGAAARRRRGAGSVFPPRRTAGAARHQAATPASTARVGPNQPRAPLAEVSTRYQVAANGFRLISPDTTPTSASGATTAIAASSHTCQRRRATVAPSA